jgi:hypothetical protein
MIAAFGASGFKTLDDLKADDARKHAGRVVGRYDWVFVVVPQGGDEAFTYWLRDGQLEVRFYYQLEHAAVGRGRHALTWWGDWWDGERAPPDLAGPVSAPSFPCPRCGSDNTVASRLTDEPYDVLLPSEQHGRRRPAGTVLVEWERRTLKAAGPPARGDFDGVAVYRLSGYRKYKGRWYN